MQRIHRHDRDPIFPDHLANAQKILPVAFDGGLLEIRYHRTGWRRLGYEINEIKRRRTAALIFSNGQHMGSLEANEYRVAAFTNSDEFLDEMDSDSQETYDLAAVICANWQDVSEISEYGDIAEVRRIWISTLLSKRGCFSVVAKMLMERLLKSRSLLVLKAFPLEYEGRVTEANQEFFLRRQRAMKRHYQRIFSVSPFPGADGAAGWMYSAPERLRGVISSPSGRR